MVMIFLPVQKVPFCYGSLLFLTDITKNRHWALCWTSLHIHTLFL